MIFDADYWWWKSMLLLSLMMVVLVHWTFRFRIQSKKLVAYTSIYSIWLSFVCEHVFVIVFFGFSSCLQAFVVVKFKVFICVSLFAIFFWFLLLFWFVFCFQLKIFFLNLSLAVNVLSWFLKLNFDFSKLPDLCL